MKFLDYIKYAEIENVLSTYKNAGQYIKENSDNDFISLFFDGDMYKYVKSIDFIFDLSNMEFKQIKKYLGLTSKQFSTLYKINIRSVETWSQRPETMKKYIKSFLCYIIFIKYFYDKN